MENQKGGLKFRKLQGAEFRFWELGFPGSRLLKNGEQKVDFALGKWRAQKLKQEGKPFLKMGQHFTKLLNRLVNYNYATDFRNPAKIRKVAKLLLLRPGYWINLLPNFLDSCSKIKTPSDKCPKLVKKTTINKLYMK